MDILLLVISVASLAANVWLVRTFGSFKLETVVRVVEIQQPAEPDPEVQVDPEPEPVSVKVDSRPKVQAWVNQRGIPMVASNNSVPQAPQQAPRVPPLARPYGFPGGQPGGQDF